LWHSVSQRRSPCPAAHSVQYRVSHSLPFPAWRSVLQAWLLQRVEQRALAPWGQAPL
jgi:hypothetical protein